LIGESLLCLPANPDAVNPEPFADFCRTIAEYRNYVHEDVMGMIQLRDRRYLPRADKLAAYKRWSRLQNANLADFEPIADLLHRQFRDLTALLDNHWRMMLDRSAPVLESPRYRRLLPPLPARPQIAQRIVLSSSIHLG
jgi:hypothetical protein